MTTPSAIKMLVKGTRAHAEALREEITAVLRPIGLRLSETKTRISHVDEGFNFLELRIRRAPKRGSGKLFVYTYPCKQALASVKAKVRKATREAQNQSLATCAFGLHR
jgi:RNA-directed DNA polymerase